MMLTRLESSLILLTGGARDLPVRQRTLRGAMDWSYSLLNAAETFGGFLCSSEVARWKLSKRCVTPKPTLA